MEKDDEAVENCHKIAQQLVEMACDYGAKNNIPPVDISIALVIAGEAAGAMLLRMMDMAPCEKGRDA